MPTITTNLAPPAPDLRPLRRSLAQAAMVATSCFTPREIHLWGLIAGGYSNAEIARRAEIRLGSVASRCFALYGRLGIGGDRLYNPRVIAALAYAQRFPDVLPLQPIRETVIVGSNGTEALQPWSEVPRAPE